MERNLNKTVNFLCKKGFSNDISVTFDQKELNAISSQNNKDFYASYTSLLCPVALEDLNTVVFCNCCSSRKNFIRNYSLILQYSKSGTFLITKQNSQNSNYIADPFLRFIQALIEQDKETSIQLALSIINEMPLFWDAYLLLCKLTDKFIYINSQLAPYFYLQLKIDKDIDPIGNLNFLKSNSFDITSLPYDTSLFNVNERAALNYCYGNQVLALSLFKSIDFYNNFDISYFELFAMLIYNTNDSFLLFLCENMNNYFKFQPETYVLTGLYRLSTNNVNEAVKLFKKAIKKRKSTDVYCLLAYSYIKLNEYGQAICEYQKALKISPANFRIFYSIAQGYFSMNKMEVSLWYCKKALDIRADGSIYKLMGRIYIILNSLDVAIKYFETSLLHDEVDSLLYMADAYRKKNEMNKALEFYEKYVLKGKKNVKVVVKYLIDYYEEHSNEEKLKLFRDFKM